MKTDIIRAIIGAAALAAFAVGPAAFAQATDEMNFGDDASPFANDGECDDPRFIGEGAAMEPLYSTDMWHDATDCSAAFAAGTVRLRTPEDIPEPYQGEEYEREVFEVLPLPDGFDYGDNSSVWAYDNECDDPRFDYGWGSDFDPTHMGRDAADCQTEYEAGFVKLAEGGGDVIIPVKAPIDSIDFGTDEGEFTSNGSCDDPRFNGAGASYDGSDTYRMKDATDCRAAYEAGSIRLN